MAAAGDADCVARRGVRTRTRTRGRGEGEGRTASVVAIDRGGREASAGGGRGEEENRRSGRFAASADATEDDDGIEGRDGMNGTRAVGIVAIVAIEGREGETTSAGRASAGGGGDGSAAEERTSKVLRDVPSGTRGGGGERVGIADDQRERCCRGEIRGVVHGDAEGGVRRQRVVAKRGSRARRTQARIFGSERARDGERTIL